MESAHTRDLAARVSHSQRAADIEQVAYVERADALQQQEFRACLLHELVLTGAPVEDSAALLAPWEEDEARLHPVAPEEALRILLTAATQGSAYGPGLYRAHGRPPGSPSPG